MNIQIATQFQGYGDGVVSFQNVIELIFTNDNSVIVVGGDILHFDNGNHIKIQERKGFETDNGFRVTGTGFLRIEEIQI